MVLTYPSSASSTVSRGAWWLAGGEAGATGGVDREGGGLLRPAGLCSVFCRYSFLARSVALPHPNTSISSSP